MGGWLVGGVCGLFCFLSVVAVLFCLFFCLFFFWVVFLFVFFGLGKGGGIDGNHLPIKEERKLEYPKKTTDSELKKKKYRVSSRHSLLLSPVCIICDGANCAKSPPCAELSCTASVTQQFVGLFCFVGCLTFQQHASVSKGQICSDNCTCCHTQTDIADKTFYLAQPQYTDTGTRTDPLTPGAWQGSHWSTTV